MHEHMAKKPTFVLKVGAVEAPLLLQWPIRVQSGCCLQWLRQGTSHLHRVACALVAGIATIFGNLFLCLYLLGTPTMGPSQPSQDGSEDASATMVQEDMSKALCLCAPRLWLKCSSAPFALRLGMMQAQK
jgi:hypothetical protein